MCFCLFVCLSVSGGFLCLDYSRSNKQIFIKKNYVGRPWPKEEVTNFWERYGSYFGYKKIMNFLRSYFNVFSVT